MSVAASQNGHPTLFHDRSFWGLNLTQFLGAFNDNLFKQLVMLLCLDQVRHGGQDLQGYALILFAAPFIAISGYAGFLSDRYSKRTIIVLCKLAEVIIVLLGMVGFMSGNLLVLLGVLCLMGVHSAFFGPSKYGILPEMLRPEDLPRANGMILMATFLAIIFGLSVAGVAMELFSSKLWVASLPCLLIAVTGLVTSLAIRPTPIAQPGLKFQISSIAVAPETRQLLWNNPTLLGVLIMSSVFWFVGGTIYPPAINALCKEQFGFKDTLAGLLAASTGVGIAIGCVAAGVLSKDRVRAWIVRLGAWGLTLSLLALALPGPGWKAVYEEIRIKRQLAMNPPAAVASDQIDGEDESKPDSDIPMPVVPVKVDAKPANSFRDIPGQNTFYRGTLLGPIGSAFALIAVGVFAGFYSVPLQVYLQSQAPTEQKGRIIGATNLMNWFGIFGAGIVYTIGRLIFIDWLMLPQAVMFGFAAALMLPVAIFYRPPETTVEKTPTAV
ncbi:MFS transporter [Schlesneria paludicola]|uniref:MFS transporter n=1 Tax=Schlesneria paludicola TaxID=360056 RepID=UPI0012F936AA|nr:MFS transporter [Schlesneria paludicola]